MTHQKKYLQVLKLDCENHNQVIEISGRVVCSILADSAILDHHLNAPRSCLIHRQLTSLHDLHHLR